MPHAFTTEEVKLLQAIANQAAIAIEHTKLLEKSFEMQEALAVRKLLERAKGYLMRSKKLTEEEAFKLIQRQSMDLRKSMRRSPKQCCLPANWKNGLRSNEARRATFSGTVFLGCERARSASCSASCFLISCNSFRNASMSASFPAGSAFPRSRQAQPESEPAAQLRGHWTGAVASPGAGNR